MAQTMAQDAPVLPDDAQTTVAWPATRRPLFSALVIMLRMMRSLCCGGVRWRDRRGEIVRVAGQRRRRCGREADSRDRQRGEDSDARDGGSAICGSEALPLKRYERDSTGIELFSYREPRCRKVGGGEDWHGEDPDRGGGGQTETGNW